MALVLACGAFLKNRACLLDVPGAPGAPDARAPATVQWSELHGDLADPAACAALADSVQVLLERAGRRIDGVAHDLHPDFFSTHLAQRIAADWGVPSFPVQHHHAHIAAVLAEHGITRPALGIALDGVGLGSDGLAWGGEVLWVDGAQCQRLGHLTPLALPGGDVAAREPWRMAAAALHACDQGTHIVPRLAPAVGEVAARTICTLLQRSLHCPQTTAAGRWFDAMAALLGLCLHQRFEAEAAIALEQAAARHLQRFPARSNAGDWSVGPDGQIDLRPLLRSTVLVAQPLGPEQTDAVAARFHLALADALVAHTCDQAIARGVADVALGGGCFYNRILRERITHGLRLAGLSVWQSETCSCGDAGLALGQAWVGAQSYRLIE